ncbi:hypothetical protein Kpol_1033p37 [Vanderwaltozyma polyspora DSM 70294]|uniref:Uncharacterized protein n=1 Tax=Vanderwaltozyma polyspora (strain ATCC 22028 / DSM 70294 / BCRC 21397 / CBS 2163 / NBRC 10782 / NRRL Y-8283 / UCD 57-17) TaxID=436907 RepID=A7TJ33_VANPO|nr:uncharacterized protein Kpol_1033p37 [Vanderwaltozyma polyspora DSM 70294]EDO17732.1 hypothetical protein Kpol_1033p37 [Vanderwaltozyma polyspora DSM 70294]
MSSVSEIQPNEADAPKTAIFDSSTDRSSSKNIESSVSIMSEPKLRSRSSKSRTSSKVSKKNPKRKVTTHANHSKKKILETNNNKDIKIGTPIRTKNANSFYRGAIVGSFLGAAVSTVLTKLSSQ